jgi:hypothetical protein
MSHRSALPLQLQATLKHKGKQYTTLICIAIHVLLTSVSIYHVAVEALCAAEQASSHANVGATKYSTTAQRPCTGTSSLAYHYQKITAPLSYAMSTL